MKKIQEIIKPFLSLILGALILLYYLNWLSRGGAALALGIIAMLMSLYYIFIGILKVFEKEKAKSLKNVFDFISLVFLPLFVLVYYLLVLITGGANVGPNGWIIALLAIVISLAMLSLHAMDAFAGDFSNPKVIQFVSMGFVLILILDILFNDVGNPIVLGNLDIILFVIYSLYTLIMLEIISHPKEKTKKEKIETKEEKDTK